MKNEKQKTIYHKVIALISLSLLLGISNNFAQLDEELTELEEFIAEETALEESTTLLPTERPVDSIFGGSRSLLDTPRSVTVINPEMMKELDLATVYDVADHVAGAQTVNYYGVPGIPHTRGLFTSIYFNGVQRNWNRNGYPTSFGSFESLDYVKGPAPGTYSAASPGGYVNFIPKSPYFDEFRGSVKITIGSYRYFNTQVDVGGPAILFGKPAAWRISVTNQDSEMYHDNVSDDYVSIYAAVKMKINDKVSVFFGGEFYQHRSNEMVGWNRVTQDLIDNSNYITGAPLNDLTGATVDIPNPFGDGVNDFITVVNQTPGSASREAVESTAPFGGIVGKFARGTPFVPEEFIPGQEALFSFVGGLNNTGNPNSPNFNGTIQTQKISGKQNLANIEDVADADTFLFFFDTVYKKSDNVTITAKFLIDAYDRVKQSFYGYGEDGKNFTMENKILVEHRMPSLLSGSTFTYGGDIRYQFARALTDFTAEPFGRIDLTNPGGGNQRTAAAAERGLDGRAFWSPFGSNESKMVTYGTFLNADFNFGEKISLIFSGRFNHANFFDRSIPVQVTFNDFSPQPGDPRPNGGKTYWNWSVHGLYKVNDNVSLYAMYQEGTSFQGYYVSGGVDNGDTNFQESSLAEAGVKMTLLENKLYSAFSVYHIDLSNFDDRGGQAFLQRGRGVEYEVSYEHNNWLSLIANVAWQEHFYRDDLLPSGYSPVTPEDTVRYIAGSILDFGNVPDRPNPGGPRFGIPDFSGSIYARASLPNGISIGIGPRFADSTFANSDKTIKLPGYTAWNGRVSYATEKWEIAVSGTNLFGEDYFLVSEPFAGNAIVTRVPQIEWRFSFTYNF